MKKMLMGLALVMLCVPADVLALSSSSRVSATTAYYSTVSNNDPSGGPVSSSDTNGSNAVANASADATTGKAGVQAYAGAGYGANAHASWNDMWTANWNGGLIDCGAFPCNFYTNITFHMDGVIDPIIANGTNTGRSLYMDFVAHYSFGNINGLNNLYITGGYDGGITGPTMNARLNNTDLTSHIQFGTPDSNGDIPFTFDYTYNSWNLVGQSIIGSSMSMDASVDNYDSASHNIDAFHTFQVSYQSLDQGITWTSDSGRTMPGLPTSSVPEPSTLLLLGSGLAGLAALKRFRR